MPALSANCLLSEDEVKAYLKIDTDWEKASDLIQRLMNFVSDAIEQYCGRNFINQTFSDIIDGEGGASFYVRCWPILDSTDDASISNPVVSFDFTGNQTWVTAASQGLTTRWDRRTGEIYFDLGGRFPLGRKNIKVDWTAGYLKEANIPGSIKLAALDILGMIKQKIDMGAFAIQSISVGQETTSFNFGEWPTSAKDALNKYRVIVC